MITVEEIVDLWQQRKQRLSPLHQAALEVRQSYYGDIVLPLPEIDRTEKPLVANLLLQGGEQKAMRLASTMPDPYYPSMSPGQKTYDKRAEDRRLVNLAWWDMDHMGIKMRKRARHMVFYAMSPVMVRPDFKECRPTWHVRNPLTTFAPEMDIGDMCPEDIIFTYTKSWSWLKKNYRDKVPEFGDMIDGTFTILEYQDADEYVLCAQGEKVIQQTNYMGNPTGDASRETVQIELERAQNRLGRCTAVVPGRIGLEHARGEFDGVIGLWQAQAKFMALQAIGMQRAIWPEEWLVDDVNGNGAQITVHADPLRGITGHVTGGKLEIIRPDLSQGSQNIIDHLERSLRLEGGIPAELGGESASNIRTARRGSDILSSAIDFPIQEEQEILGIALRDENQIGIAIDKAYFPTRKMFFVGPTSGQVEYTAQDLWETDVHWVRYSSPGVDASGQVVENGQRIGIGVMSKRTAMENDPAIADPAGEFDRINGEHLDAGLLNGLGAMAQDPAMAPIVAKVAVSLRRGEMEIPDAVIAVHEAMQKMQAEQAAQQAQAAPPGMPPDQATQPGMAQPVPSIAPPPGGLGNLTQLLQQLKRGSNASVQQTPGLVGAAPGT